ncbi:hypothetical protein ES711_11505 [Gelidibacter salicanalis]|uniref:Haem-binding domain-containing protein n=1 Tax=Gelidibacter salicanalis TaxID=291193 RepID=A0A5C7AF39_9FLAO|nr:heme-binding domain-containing protein [Gelidibacter salicanalis]TXE07386.1 hypothetical protein ES711_11505 [Gelidibacter salicanalis]
MKVIKIIAGIALFLLVAIQFFPTDRNESYTVLSSDFMLVNTVPTDIQKKLKASCYDCHSNLTAYPWYNKVQPIAWFLEDHVKEGKAELNFNEWDTYSDRRKKSKLRSIIKQIENDEMPLKSYTYLHRDAILSQEDANIIINFMNHLKDSLQ